MAAATDTTATIGVKADRPIGAEPGGRLKADPINDAARRAPLRLVAPPCLMHGERHRSVDGRGWGAGPPIAGCSGSNRRNTGLPTPLLASTFTNRERVTVTWRGKPGEPASKAGAAGRIAPQPAEFAKRTPPSPPHVAGPPHCYWSGSKRHSGYRVWSKLMQRFPYRYIPSRGQRHLVGSRYGPGSSQRQPVCRQSRWALRSVP